MSEHDTAGPRPAVGQGAACSAVVTQSARASGGAQACLLLGSIPLQHSREETQETLGLGQPVHLGLAPHGVGVSVLLGVSADQVVQGLGDQLSDHDSQRLSTTREEYYAKLTQIEVLLAWSTSRP